MAEVRYVTEIKPVTVCEPVRPQETIREKKVIFFVEGEIKNSLSELKRIKKAIKKHDSIFLYYWAYKPEQQMHYLTRRKNSNCTGSILITNYDILQGMQETDAIYLYDLYDMKHNRDYINKILGENILLKNFA